MKKAFKFALAAMAAAAMTLSCTPTTTEEKEVAEPLETPEYAEVAQKIEFAKDNTLGLRSIEFTESGLAIIERIQGVTPQACIQVVKSDPAERVIIEVRTYTYNGNVFTITEFGTVTVTTSGSNTTATVTGSDGKPVSEPVTVPEKQEGTGIEQLCRAWVVEETSITIKGGSFSSAGIGRTFKGCNVDAIAEYAKENGVNITEQIVGYNVKSISYTATGTFLIDFESAEDFKGEWKLGGFKADANGVLTSSFDYELDYELGNSIINANATGNIVIKDPKCTVTINGEITNGSTKYTTAIEFVLKDSAK